MFPNINSKQRNQTSCSFKWILICTSCNLQFFLCFIYSASLLSMASSKSMELSAVKTFIEHGADPNCPALSGTNLVTPLANALSAYRLDVVDYLLEKGAFVLPSFLESQGAALCSVPYWNKLVSAGGEGFSVVNVARMATLTVCNYCTTLKRIIMWIIL